MSVYDITPEYLENMCQDLNFQLTMETRNDDLSYGVFYTSSGLYINVDFCGITVWLNYNGSLGSMSSSSSSRKA